MNYSARFIAFAALLGIAIGYFTIHSVFEHSWTSMILWVTVGLVMLYFSPDRRTALIAGCIFGFCTIAIWLVSGFQGSQSARGGFAVLTLLLSILGGACGTVGAYLFYKLFRR